ncbi:MAG: hypothetical protein Q9218_007152 [Villophora microphyllina]
MVVHQKNLNKSGVNIDDSFIPRYIPTIAVRVHLSVLRNNEQYRNLSTMPKRKSSAALAQPLPLLDLPIQAPVIEDGAPPPKRRASARTASQTKTLVNPDENADVLDAPDALRASPDASGEDEQIDIEKAKQDDDFVANGDSDPSLSDMSDIESLVKTNATPVKVAKKAGGPQPATGGQAKKPAAPVKGKKDNTKEPQFLDPEADGEEEADEEELQAALARPPPVNNDYLPLPWKGRLGYACLNTYLRFSNPPVFSSRTCRIASILENRHPLRDPNEPPHATKNRPDRDQPADLRRGQEFVEQLCLANVRDIPKMLRWNDRYGIKFMRLSSEMFPFASHEEYGYKLAPFASEALAEAGKVAAELGHRLTTHPGQYTQLGSPRKSVIDNALRDLDYHAEMLSLLKLPPQQDRDAVMILHLGGVFGDKEATLNRFRENYVGLPQGVKDRLVLENDDVSWSVHELLPLCEELNIPMVLDFHHHNIIFDPTQIREGTKDIVDLYPRILATWKRKNITPKMHYSEPTPAAITGRQRRKHNPRPATLPPCPPDMDLMIEAKDKEQAVFELMRTFKLPGFDTFNDMLPHTRKDDNKPIKTPKKKTPKKKSKKVKEEEEDSEEETPEPVQGVISDDEVGMGGPEGRVYWPPGQEEWLRPKKRVVAPKKSKGPPGKELDEKGRIITPAMRRKMEKEEQNKVKSEEQDAAQAEGERLAQEIEMDLDSANVNGDVKANGKSAKAKPKANGAKKTKSKDVGKANVEAAAVDDENLAKEMEMEVDGGDADGEVKSKDKGGKTKARSKTKSKDDIQVDGETIPPATLGRRASGRAKKVDYAEE